MEEKKKQRGDGASRRRGGAATGEEIPFELVTAIPSLPWWRAVSLRSTEKASGRAGNGVQVSRFRGGRGAEGKWWRRGEEVSAAVGPFPSCLFIPFPVAELGFPPGLSQPLEKVKQIQETLLPSGLN
jgi:hypothetical protein